MVKITVLPESAEDGDNFQHINSVSLAVMPQSPRLYFINKVT